MRRRSVQRGRRVPLRVQLPLLALSRGNRLGLQALCRHRAGEARDHGRRERPSDRGGGRSKRHALRGVRLPPLLGRAGRRLCPRCAGVTASTLRACARRSTSSSAPRRRGSRSRTTCRSSKSTRHRELTDSRTIWVRDRDPRHPVRAERRRGDRVPGSRRRAGRPRLRAVLRQHPLELGAAALRPLSRAARVVLPPDPVRQARHRALRPAAHADARDADGRHPRSAGRGRFGARGAARRHPGQPALRALRRDLPERTRALVLYHPHVAPSDLAKGALPTADEARERWGTRQLADEITRADSSVARRRRCVRSWFADSCASQRAPVPPRSSSACSATPTSPTSCRRSGCRRSWLTVRRWHDARNGRLS